jgi:CheY-like chemotaxis protein
MGLTSMTDKMPTIVVVDDSATSISLYQFSVEPLAVNFIGFKSPAEALPYLQEHQPDLLFLDIIMPGMDGLTFLRRLRELTLQKDTPVIMVTSKDYAQDRYIAKQLGALDFLIKPLRFKEIRDIVCQYAGVKPNQSVQS